MRQKKSLRTPHKQLVLRAIQPLPIFFVDTLVLPKVMIKKARQKGECGTNKGAYVALRWR